MMRLPVQRAALVDVRRLCFPKLCAVHHRCSSSTSEARGSAASPRTPTTSRGSSEPHTISIHPARDATTADDIRKAFEASVVARTVGNSALRKYIHQRHDSEIDLVEAAVEGCKNGGLKVDEKTSEVILHRLVEAGRVKKALELHSTMTKSHMTPTSAAYNILMRMCLERGMPGSVESLFDDMSKRGRSPDAESYELVISALAAESPPKWEKAIAIFDRITTRSDRSSAVNKISAKTYNALMRVYLNMSPFDWRVVYNCYYELRQLHPKVQLTWESYELVRDAFHKGRAGRFRRILTFVDAWFVLTHIKTIEFWAGMGLFIAAMMGVKGFVGYWVSTWKHSAADKEREAADNMLTTM